MWKKQTKTNKSVPNRNQAQNLLGMRQQVLIHRWMLPCFVRGQVSGIRSRLYGCVLFLSNCDRTGNGTQGSIPTVHSSVFHSHLSTIPLHRPTTW